MANLGKRFLSAFVEVTDEETPVTAQEEKQNISTSAPMQKNTSVAAADEKFRQYFEQLFKDANLPGPDFFEFSKMIEAMQVIPDEKARYTAAFAGLSVQGLGKQKLLDTAAQYLQILDADANNFNNTVDAALKEKVHGKQQLIESNAKRIEALSKEINDLQQQMAALQQEVKENEEKIENNSGAYTREMQQMKQNMAQSMEKIKNYL